MRKYTLVICKIVIVILLWFFSIQYLAKTPLNVLAYEVGCICAALIMVIINNADN